MSVTAIVLAAGKGTRMKSSRAKVLHQLFFAPMLHHVLDVLTPLALEKTVVVVGHQGDAVEQSVEGYDVRFVRQAAQLGTGHAVLVCQEEVCKDAVDTVLILCGDCPLIRSSTLEEMIQFHTKAGNDLTVMSTFMDDPTHYGRVISDSRGGVSKIVEEKDASEEERSIREINAGIYCVKKDLLFEALGQVGTENKQGEVYLTDIVRISVASGGSVQKFICPDPGEVLGVNSQVELEQAHSVLRERRNLQLMQEGVSILDSRTVFIEKSVRLGRDVVIHPNVVLSGQTRIEDGVEIEPFCVIHGSYISAGKRITAFTKLPQ